MVAMSPRQQVDPAEIPKRGSWLLEVSIIVTLVLIGGWHVYDTVQASRGGSLAPGINMITAPDAARMLDEGVGLLLDVRPTVAGKVMIRGAVHAPEAELTHLAETLPRNMLLITYCDCALDSAAIHVAIELRKMGFQSVAALRDGIYGWMVEDLPIQYGD